jgi:ABC-type uncharacterized transport system substrate-binding protein
MGLMTSLSRPGGNITDVANLNVELGPKKLELLHELVPTATVIGLLVNPANPNNEIRSKDMEAATRTLGLEVDVLRASTEREIDNVFASLFQASVRALIVHLAMTPDGVKTIVTAKRKLPASWLLAFDPAERYETLDAMPVHGRGRYPRPPALGET